MSFLLTLLPLEITTQIGAWLSDGCLPVPRAIAMQHPSATKHLEDLRRAIPVLKSREILFAFLRAAYRPTARLRCVSRDLAAAPWLLPWDELYDFVHGTVCNPRVPGVVFHHMFDPSEFSSEALIPDDLTDLRTKRMAIQLAMQHGTSEFIPVFPPACNRPMENTLRAIDPDFALPRFASHVSGPLFQTSLAQSAKRVVSDVPTDDVAFPYIGIRNPNSVTGAAELHFFDELELTLINGNMMIVDPASRSLRRLDIRPAYLRRRASNEQLDLRTMKRETLRRWMALRVAHQKETWALGSKLRMRLKRK